MGGNFEDRASEAPLLQGVARASQATFHQGAVLSPTSISPSDQKHDFLGTVQGIDRELCKGTAALPQLYGFSISHCHLG